MTCFRGSLLGLPATVTSSADLPMIPHSSWSSLRHANSGSSLYWIKPPGKARAPLYRSFPQVISKILWSDGREVHTTMTSVALLGSLSGILSDDLIVNLRFINIITW